MNNIRNEFIPYEQALALKELEFDKTCVMAYYHLLSEDKKDKLFMRYNDNKTNSDNAISAPLYQQAFEFFRDKHKLLHSIIGVHSTEPFELDCEILNISNGSSYQLSYSGNNYEEAELKTLKKLIEITQNTNKK